MAEHSDLPIPVMSYTTKLAEQRKRLKFDDVEKREGQEVSQRRL